MTGRGIDQIMAHPCNPALHESYVHSAIDYVRLAEALNGPIPHNVDPSYIWGEALNELKLRQPDARIINLETSITRSEDFVPKGINYRMSPENADCLRVADIDCCVLANNHVLDWGRVGVVDTLDTLNRLQIAFAGAGRDLQEASAPAVLDIAGKGRVLIFAFACPTSGAPRNWLATTVLPGVNILSDLSPAAVKQIAEQVARIRQPRDVTIVSLHWGPNWGYDIPDEQRSFAHALIDAGIAIIYGHSSHHAKAIEAYQDGLILYGCGDFLNDYEGITGDEEYRSDLALMYFVDIMPARGTLVALEIVPLQIRKFQLIQPSSPDVGWVQDRLDRESRQFGTRVELKPSGALALN